MHWLPAGDGYEVTLDGPRVVARRAGTGAGRPLRSLPKALKDDDAVLGLRQLREWLDRHEQSCRADVEAWLVRSLPVPTAALVAVWPDPAWQAVLRDLVVVPLTGGPEWDMSLAGLLRDVDTVRGVGLVNLDGDSIWHAVESIALPHPVLLDELEDLREFAADLGVTQGTHQLFRETWPRPAGRSEREAAVRQYAGGHYAELRHLTGRAVAHGYPVRGGYATCRIHEGGRTVVAAVWVGVDDPGGQTETGDLSFARTDGAAVPLDEVGPVAWSEGMRMAADLYAGRVVEEGRAA